MKGVIHILESKDKRSANSKQEKRGRALTFWASKKKAKERSVDRKQGKQGIVLTRYQGKREVIKK